MLHVPAEKMKQEMNNSIHCVSTQTTIKTLIIVLVITILLLKNQCEGEIKQWHQPKHPQLPETHQ